MRDKRSFVLYSDILHTLEHLTNEQAGQLFRTILQYVNDQNPVINDPLIKIAFEPVRQNLKRDLDKWQSIRQKRVEAGRKGGKQKVANASNSEQDLTNQAVIVNDSVNVNVSDILNHFNKCFNKKARVIPVAAVEKYKELYLQGYDITDIKKAMNGAANEKWHKDKNYDVCTLYYFTKIEVIDRYSNLSTKHTKYIPTK